MRESKLRELRWLPTFRRRLSLVRLASDAPASQWHRNATIRWRCRQNQQPPSSPVTDVAETSRHPPGPTHRKLQPGSRTRRNPFPDRDLFPRPDPPGLRPPKRPGCAVSPSPEAPQIADWGTPARGPGGRTEGDRHPRSSTPFHGDAPWIQQHPNAELPVRRATRGLKDRGFCQRNCDPSRTEAPR